MSTNVPNQPVTFLEGVNNDIRQFGKTIEEYLKQGKSVANDAVKATKPLLNTTREVIGTVNEIKQLIDAISNNSYNSPQDYLTTVESVLNGKAPKRRSKTRSERQNRPNSAVNKKTKGGIHKRRKLR